MNTLELSKLWLKAKSDEHEAQERRRSIEDQLSEALKVDDKLDGVQTTKLSDFTVKVTTRLNRKVDADLVQEIASENDMGAYLAQLFRWKPDINLTAWKNAPKEVINKLSKAITTTASRPSFSITTVSKE
jgi:hypothetical protein